MTLQTGRFSKASNWIPAITGRTCFWAETCIASSVMTRPWPLIRRLLSSRRTILSRSPFWASVWAAKGERQRALDIIQQVRVTEDRTEPAVLVATIYARLGMADEMFQWLERAVALKSTPVYIPVLTQDFEPYRTDPRYHAFLASIGLSHLACS